MWEEGFRIFSYDTRIEPASFWILVSAAVIVSVIFAAYRSPRRNPVLFCKFLLAEYAVAILLVTIVLRKRLAVPEGFRQSFWGDKAFLIEDSLSEVAANVLLFIPIGVLSFWGMRNRRLLKTMAIGLGLSLVIESLQGFTQKGVADVNDVVSNGLGAAIGYGLGLGLLWLKGIRQS